MIDVTFKTSCEFYCSKTVSENKAVSRRVMAIFPGYLRIGAPVFLCVGQSKHCFQIHLFVG